MGDIPMLWNTEVLYFDILGVFWVKFLHTYCA